MQWLALAGGLTAVAAFWVDRRDRWRAEAASVYVMVTLFQGAPPPPGKATFTRFQVFNGGRLPALSVGVAAWEGDADEAHGGSGDTWAG